MVEKVPGREDLEVHTNNQVEDKHYKRFNVEYRHEQGVEHHVKAKEMFKLISNADRFFGEDYFCWKSGGDGDNGEILMYQLSALFEYLEQTEGKNVLSRYLDKDASGEGYSGMSYTGIKLDEVANMNIKSDEQ